MFMNPGAGGESETTLSANPKTTRERGGGGNGCVRGAGEAFCVRGNSDKWNSDESGKRRRGKGGATKVLRGQKPTLSHRYA